VLNVAGPKDLTKAEVQKLVSSVVDGSASSAPTTQGNTMMTPISSLPGFKKITGGTATATGALEEQYTQFLSKNFPSI